MKCPKCSADIPVHEESGRNAIFICPECGWGEEKLNPPEVSARARLLWYLQLAGLWVLTVVILIGPWVGLHYLFEYLSMEVGGMAQIEEMTDDLAAGLNRHYWWVMLLYILLCWSIRLPGYDPGNLGMFGSHPGRSNPAITSEQHYNRFMNTIHLFLMPGQIVATTVTVTWGLFRGEDH